MSEQLESGTRPWERQPDEPSKAFNAFAIYRDLSPAKRSLAAVSRALYGARSGRDRGAPGRIREWSTRHQWCKRAEAWDSHLDDEARQAAVEARRAMQERHLSGMAAVYERLMGALEKADDHIPVDRAARAIRETILAEREVATRPITPDPSGPAPGAAAASLERSVTIEDMRRFECTPEMMASVVRILDQYESKVYPPDPDPNGDEQGDPLGDAEPSSPAATHAQFVAQPEADDAV